MSTAVPPVTFTPTGVSVPAAAAVLAGVQSDINNAFGGNLNTTSLNTRSGQLASSQAACIDAGNSSFAYFASQIDPATSQGFMQDALGQLYFLTRLPGIATVVTCVLTGLNGDTIPIGAQAIDTSGNIYYATQAGTFSSGTLTLPFQNIALGPIPCPDGTLTGINLAIPGVQWNTIDNPGPGSAVLGSNVESSQQFEARRAASVALNSHGPVQAIKANVLQVPGVIDCYAYENVTGATQYVGSDATPVLPHSIFVGVAGGIASAVVAAIWNKKAPGCNYNGATTVNIEDTVNYSPPYPTYPVSFTTLMNSGIIINVALLDTGNLPADIVSLIQTAVINQFTGVNGAGRAQAGGYILAASYYAPVLQVGVALGITLAIAQITIGGTFSGTVATSVGSNLITLTVSSGFAGIGSVLVSANIGSFTQIVRQVSGTLAGSGVYVISSQATLTASGTSISGTPNQAVLIGIDQEPTSSAGNINVVIL